MYNNLATAYKELGYKKDLENLKELDDLLYCEAEGFMLKIMERIDKKANAKNLKLYKKLAELKDEDIITCNG